MVVEGERERDREGPGHAGDDVEELLVGGELLHVCGEGQQGR